MANKFKVIIVDDSELNRELIVDILGDKYDYIYAENGARLIDLLTGGVNADIILLDINMPVMDGFEVLKIMNERHWLEETPVVVISAESDGKFLETAYSLGATDYISRPFSTSAVRFRVENTLKLYLKQRQLVQLVEEQVYRREEVNDTMISIFSHAIGLVNSESGLHMLNIRKITDLLLHKLTLLTDKYNLTEKRISEIATLSSLHDLGKIVIPQSILNKPGKLTPDEWETMKTHTTEGDYIISTTAALRNTSVVSTAREIVRWHHEKWDGGGYPDGLSGDNIPISAQVVAIADIYDALTSERCYKKAFTHSEAIGMICGGECGAFNPLLLECLRAVEHELEKLTDEKTQKFDYESEAKTLAREMLEESELPLDDRARRLLVNEREKKEFFRERIGGAQFEYDAASKKVVLTGWRDGEPFTKEIYPPAGDRIDFLSKDDLDVFRERLKATTRENPDVSMKALILIDGEYRWCRIDARTIWSQRGNYYVNIVGQFTDIHEEVIRSGLDVLTDGKGGVAAIYGAFKKIFDIVILVDPNTNTLLELSDDGKIIETPRKCYNTWNRETPCENCSAIHAYANKGIATSLEVKGIELYSVISKYLKIGKRDCILQFAFRISDAESSSRHLPEKTRLLLLDFYRDSLTDTFTRKYLEDFRSNLEGSRAVAMIDIDKLKQINDTLGHLAGDAAIKRISEIILSSIVGKGIAIRYGGDEYLLLFDEIDEKGFRELLEKLERDISTSALEEYPDLDFTVSIGGAYGEKCLSDAIGVADSEMYKNKAQKANNKKEK